MPHGVERQEVVLANTIRLAEELETGFQDTRLGVLEGNSHAEHSAAIVMVEIYTFRDLPSSNTEEDSASAVAARCAIGLKSQRGFLCIRRFDEDEFIFPDFVKGAHALPRADYKLHVEVRGEEDDDAVGGDFREF